MRLFDFISGDGSQVGGLGNEEDEESGMQAEPESDEDTIEHEMIFTFDSFEAVSRFFVLSPFSTLFEPYTCHSGSPTPE